MSEVIRIINQLTGDLRTLVLAALLLVLFYELIAFLFAFVHIPRIGIIGVLLVALGVVVLPAVLAYVTSL